MGPKKGGKKKGKKSGGGDGSAKKKKDSDGDVLTFKEAVMTYQFEVKQLQLSKLKENVEEWKGRNDREKQRNLYLRKEQNRHVKDVLVNAQENEEELKKQEQVPFNLVEDALNEKLATIRVEESSVEELKEKIKDLDGQLITLSNQLQALINYKDEGQNIDRTHIQVLLKEMEDMDTSYAEMANFFDKSLATMKQTITKQNHENIAVQKNLASEEVIRNMDKHTEQEFSDNEWLRKEVNIHRNHIIGAEAEIESLEKQNIVVMNYLFEQQVDDLKQTKRFHLTCKAAEEESSEGEGEEETLAEDGEGAEFSKQEVPDDLKWLDDYLHEFDGAATQEEYKLGPVEVKLLCVVGTQVPLHDVNEIPADAMMTSAKGDPHYKWVVEKDELRL